MAGHSTGSLPQRLWPCLGLGEGGAFGAVQVQEAGLLLASHVTEVSTLWDILKPQYMSPPPPLSIDSQAPLIHELDSPPLPIH